MLMQVIETFELMDNAHVNGKIIADYLNSNSAENIEVETISTEKGSTDFIKITIPGSEGKSSGGSAPTLGITGRLGGLGARPQLNGFVSDGDGALAAIAIAAKLARMTTRGDQLKGDIIVTTHICPDAPTRDHKPVPFMDSPVAIETMNAMEVCDEMDGVLSIDTTKGNQVINTCGFAISPTVKQGYILKTATDVLDIMARTTGKLPQVFPLAQQDITPYGNGLYHLNSILQPAVATGAPVIGIAITTEVPVAGCATGATREVDVESASRFAIEVAKSFTNGECQFYDPAEFAHLIELYGPMEHFQTK